MQPTTLRGVFPERPVVHRRNFIRENVKRIKQITSESGRTRSESSAKKIGCGSRMHVTTSNLSKLKLNGNSTAVKRSTLDRNTRISDLIVSDNISHRSMQTEESNDQIVTSGVIKYPSSKRSPPRLKRGGGDNSQNASANHLIGKTAADMDISITNARTDYIRNNIRNLRSNAHRKSPANHNENLAPPANYKKGIVPKYINQKKEALKHQREEVIDIHCPPGHVLLPEDERKETLRVLRESYAEKIQEMNSLPVRSDTLKMQKRKMDLESELNKIDEGIKVFQRPKVYVKVNV